MASKKFYLLYAQLMEHYQFIEEFLERIYAVLSGKSYLDGLQDVDRSPLPTIVKSIQKLEKEQQITVFTKDEYDTLFEIIKRRNFWAHECFCTLIFNSSSEELKHIEDKQRMSSDFLQAEEWRERTFERLNNFK